MSSSSSSLNVDDYTISQLYDILDMQGEDVIPDDVVAATDEYIRDYQSKGEDDMAAFFSDIQRVLLDDLSEREGRSLEQTDRWYKYQALPQSNSVQRNKNTNRVQKIDVFADTQQVPMNREQLGVADTHEVPVTQDTLNPTLRNVKERFINLDSQFRQSTGGVDSAATDYTLDLSEPLLNVLSLRLYSYQIPYTWYAIDASFGNTCFWVTNSGQTYKVSVSEGNYSRDAFVVELSAAFVSAGFTGVSVSAAAASAKLTIDLSGATDPRGIAVYSVSGEAGSFNADTDAYFTFFDFSAKLLCDDGGVCNRDHTFNQTLGWIMGFRAPILPVLSGGNTGAAVLDLNGPKYFLLVLDDFNQNHINNSVVVITQLSTSLSIPSYYNTAMPHDCVVNTGASSVLANPQIMGDFALINRDLFPTANAVLRKSDVSYGKTAVVVPTAPRTLTQAQIYTANEIVKNRDKTTSYRGKAPNNSDTFAVIPIKMNGTESTGQMYVDFSGSLQDNKRTYFGPVNIDRMRIHLVDDRGYTVNLHGSEWCVTILAELLYQY